jgi:hypothetical protein
MRRMQMVARQGRRGGEGQRADGSPRARTGEVPVFRRIKAAEASLTSTGAGAKDDGQLGPSISMMTMLVLQHARGRLGAEAICKREVVCVVKKSVVSAQRVVPVPQSRVSVAFMPSHAGAITSLDWLTPRCITIRIALHHNCNYNSASVSHCRHRVKTVSQGRPLALRRHVGSLLLRVESSPALAICEYPHEHGPPLAAAQLAPFSLLGISGNPIGTGHISSVPARLPLCRGQSPSHVTSPHPQGIALLQLWPRLSSATQSSSSTSP